MFASTLLKQLSPLTAGAAIALLGMGTGFFAATPVKAATLFRSRTAFEGQLSNLIIDDYENAAYLAGDKFDGDRLDIHTNRSMTNVLGETRYESVRFEDHNLIVSRGSGHRYCTGCNGDFWLDFTQTSIGNALGVFGAGFELSASQNYLARVLFGDGSREEFSLTSIASGFWGITSAKQIQKIYLGINDSSTQQGNEFVEIDNLTIGSAAIAVPDDDTVAPSPGIPIPSDDTSGPQSVPEPASTLGLLLLLNFGQKRSR